MYACLLKKIALLYLQHTESLHCLSESLSVSLSIELVVRGHRSFSWGLLEEA